MCDVSNRDDDLRATKELPPLQWWRGDQLDPLAPAELVSLRRTLVSVAVPGQRDWALAARGDAPAAIRIALRIGAACDGFDWRLDCAASAVLLCAAEGNAAAKTALAHLRRHFLRRVRRRQES